MKKKLIALALAGAFAAPAAALAQGSNVTIYGVLDVGFQNARATGATAGAAGNKDSHFRVNSSSSLLGFRGTEDLGGGLSAIWQLESSVTPDAGGAWSGGRDHYVGLKGDFGTIRMGLLTTKFRVLSVLADVMPGATNIGSYTGAANGIFGTVGSYTGGAPSATAPSTHFDNRIPNALNYISPNWNGFEFDVTYSANEAESRDGAAVKLDPYAWNVTGTYINGPLTLGLGYEKHNDVSAATPITLYTALGAPAFTTTGSDDTAWRFVAAYKFGNTSVRFMWERAEWEVDGTIGGVGGNADYDKNTWGIGLTHNVGAGQIRAQFARASDGSCSAGGSFGSGCSADGLEAKLFSIGYGHALSKRTELYAYYSQIRNDSLATYDFANGGFAGGATAAGAATAAAAGSDPKGVAVGIRHTF